MTCVLFGSQTGQAKSIAEEIFDKLQSVNKNTHLFELDDIEKSYDIFKLNYAIIICSTTGDGDPPDNASSFVRKIKLYQPNSLKNFKYTILGLGDTNYSKFCNCAKTIDKLLELLGAQRFYQSGWADDAVGLELVIEPWLDGFYAIADKISSDLTSDSFQALAITETVVKIDQESKENNDESSVLFGDVFADDIKSQNLTVPSLPLPFLNVTFKRESSTQSDFLSPIITTAAMPSSCSDVSLGQVEAIDKLTKKFSVKSVFGMTVNITDNDWNWKAGDSVGILPCNSSNEVDEILTRLLIPKSDWDCPVELSVTESSSGRRAKMPEHLIVRGSDTIISIKSILIWLCDIRQPMSKASLRLMAELCPAGSREQRRLLELCSREGQAFYSKCIREPMVSVLDLLNWFPSCNISIERLLEFLPRLKPRAYSLCDLNQISFAFSKVDIAPKPPFRKRPLTGVCTSWMENMVGTVLNSEKKFNIPIYLRKNSNGFTIGDDPTVPHILIGPGTGVAPFIGFLKHFEDLKKSGIEIGPVWLFFGCRNEERDFIFRDQMKYFFENGILTHICVCFSRQDSSKHANENRFFCHPANCKYVQDCLLFHSQTLTKLLIDDNARIFVCGSSVMSKGVLETWSKLLVGNHERTQSRKEADSFIASMRVKKLYLEDVWV